MTDPPTPFHLKRPGDEVPPDEPFCHQMTANGLFISRSTDLFKSLVPARKPPSYLAPQKPMLTLSYPKLPADLVSKIVGFMWTIAYRYGGEAAVLLGMDARTREIVPIVPPQLATIGWDFHGKP